jgi:hypothetical protein
MNGASNNEDCNPNLVNEVNIVDIGGLMTMHEDSYFDNVDVEGSSTPMDQALTCLHEKMANITTEYIPSASIELRDHATSFI